MEFGLCTIANKSEDAAAVIAAAGAAGYDAVEVWGEDHVGDGTPERCAALRSAAADAGVALAVYGSYLRCGSREFADTYERELALADELGVDRIRVWLGTCDYEDRTDADWERAVADLQRITDAAARRGLAVTVETHGGSLTNRPEGARRAIEAVEGPCGLNWQPLFDKPADALPDEARDLAPLTNNVHVQAVPERGSSDRCPLDEAYFDVGACLAALRDGGFDGLVAVEFVADDRPFAEAIAADLAVLREWDRM
jgi:sugar phosphate isomerase/epimerase